MGKKSGTRKGGKLLAVVRQVFPSEVRSAKIVRTMIAVNALLSMKRMLLDIDARKGDGLEALQRGDRLINFLLSIGVLKEAMDAFKDIKDWFEPYMRTDAEKEAYDALCRACDKEDQASLYSRVVKPLRHGAGFHWELMRIQPILDFYRETDQKEEIYVSYDGSLGKSRFTFADEILERMVSHRMIVEQLEKLPFESFPATLQVKISYSRKEKRLTLMGDMTTDERDQLLALSNDSNYQKAVDNLFQKFQAIQPIDTDIQDILAIYKKFEFVVNTGMGETLKKKGASWISGEETR